MEPHTRGRGAVRPAPSPIREVRTLRWKCCASSSNIRSRLPSDRVEFDFGAVVACRPNTSDVAVQANVGLLGNWGSTLRALEAAKMDSSASVVGEPRS